MKDADVDVLKRDIRERALRGDDRNKNDTETNLMRLR